MPGRAPGPPALPLLGHSVAFVRDKLGFLTRCARDYGDVVQLHLGGSTLLVVHPQDIRHVLAGNAANYCKSPRVTGAFGLRWIGRNVLTTEGSEHQRLRRALQPLFRPNAIEPFDTLIVGQTEQAVRRWIERGTIDAAVEMRELALRCALAMLLGANVLSRFPQLMSAVETRRRYVDRLFSSPLPLAPYWPTRLNRAQRRTQPQLLEMFAAALEAAAKEKPDPCLTRVLLQGSAGGLSRAEICDQLLALSVAGYETVTELLTWSLFLWTQQPKEAATVTAEIDQVVRAGAPAATEVMRCEHLQRWLDEVLRLYPPTWLFVRIAREADVLPSGAQVPAATKIYLSQFVTQRDARFFADPESFDPQRFTAEATRARAPFAYFPFGGGPRLCLGEALDRMEAALIVATIAQRVRVELVPGQRIDPVPGVTLTPSGPVRVTVRPR